MLTGGPGQDTIFADATSASCGWYSYTCKIPFGNDVVNARDGEADTIDCGVGEDRATVDKIDVVSGCETVDVAGGGSGPEAPAGNTDKPAPTFAYKLKGTKLNLTVPCAGACKVSATLTVKKKTIGKASKTLLKAGDAKLTVKVKKQKKTVTRDAEGHGPGRRRHEVVGDQDGEGEALAARPVQV